MAPKDRIGRPPGVLSGRLEGAEPENRRHVLNGGLLPVFPEGFTPVPSVPLLWPGQVLELCGEAAEVDRAQAVDHEACVAGGPGGGVREGG